MGKHLSIFNSKNIPWAFLFALLFLLGVYFTELFILPINFFTFRAWEALAVQHLHSLLPGPFYPNMNISITEEGDLGHHTIYAVKKNVHWQTDKYGHRKHDENLENYEIVVIGDSVTAGSGLTQEDMFSEQLERRLNVKVYPLAPASVNTFLNTERFLKFQPKIVILESIEGEISNLPSLEEIKSQSVKWPHIKRNNQLAVLLDRFSKQIFFHYIESSIIRKLKGKLNKPAKMLFYDDFPLIKAEYQIPKIVQKIKTYKEILNSMGIRFIFFPFPNKETIYAREFLNKDEPVFLKQLIEGLKSAGIEVIDVEESFEKAFSENNVLAYHLDDTHWNSFGVRLAVDATVKILTNSRP